MSKKSWILTISAVIFLFIGYAAYDVWSYGEDVERIETDAAIVLGAAAWHKNPSPVLQGRIDQAIWLYEKGYTDTLIFTGGKGEGAPYAESEVAKEYALEHGVPETDVLIETSSDKTENNLQNAYELGKKAGLKKFSIVSDPLHMKRAMLLAEDLGMEAYSSPTQNSAFQSWHSKLPFFLREWCFYVGYLVTWPVSRLMGVPATELLHRILSVLTS